MLSASNSLELAEKVALKEMYCVQKRAQRVDETRPGSLSKQT